MAKRKHKHAFPNQVLVIKATDIADDPVLLCAETPEEIGEEYEGEVVAVYELKAIGKFNVEKSVDGDLVKSRKQKK